MFDLPPLDFQSLSDNRFFLMGMAVLLLRIKSFSSNNRFAVGIINLFGTFFHELTHWLVGWLLNAKPVGFTVWPRRNIDGAIVLGAVTLMNIRFYNALPTALSPLLLLPLAFVVEGRFFDFFPATLPALFGLVFATTFLLENAIPSRADFRIAFGNIWGLLFYLAVGVGVYGWLTGKWPWGGSMQSLTTFAPLSIQ
ncbi:MAG: hypothetical protein HQL52_09220 [Magnetococcales bacterium]|nr:hypothetical protein [Magnetococcales bacterium]